VTLLEGSVDRILIDRMNYLETIVGLYRRLGLSEAASDPFFRRQARRMADEARRRGIACEILF